MDEPRRYAPGYGLADRARWVDDPPHVSRGAFARDRARVVHSSALRRLSDKTQVFGAGVDDFVRNRLTHSLEVAQIGRELALALGCEPDVVDAACLAHDLGHPPFGHNGEKALDEVARQVGGFEGNAQTLRLLTRLEPKRFDPVTGRSVGLNLTRATLDACLKYPWTRAGAAGRGTAKFGVYDDDLAVYGWVRQGAPEGRRCVEAQVMDFADDVAYCVHDVEDAVVGGHVQLGDLRDDAVVARVAARARSWYLPEVGDDEVAAAVHRLRALPVWPETFAGGLRDLGALKSLTSRLIGRFSAAVEQATLACSGPDGVHRYDGDVVVPRETLHEITALKAVAAEFVMGAESRRERYRVQRDLITGLVEAVVDGRLPADGAPRAGGAPHVPVFGPEAGHGAGADGRLRWAVDRVACLTDSSAVALGRDLGLAVPGPSTSGGGPDAGRAVLA